MAHRYVLPPPALVAAAALTFALSSASHAAREPAVTSHPVADHIRDLDFESTLSRSFETILSDEELERYTASDSVARRRMRARFWLSNDPTPGSPENEFLEEHLRRLSYVLENFCAKREGRWDARGDVALRFGLPPSRQIVPARFGTAFGGMGLVPPGETWFYPRGGMSFHFIDANLDDCFDMGVDSKEMMARGTPTPVWDGQLDGPSTPGPTRTDMEGDLAARNSRRLSDRGLRALYDVPVAYTYRAPREPLDLFYEVVLARSPSGSCDVALNYQVNRAQMGFSETRGTARGTLRKELRVFDMDYRVIAADERLLVVADSGEQRTSSDLIADEWRFSAAPGEYIAGITVTDTATGRSANGKSRFEVPAYLVGGLSMSDVMISTAVGAGDRFRRMGGSVVPHPARSFRRSDQLVIYFELYGLVEDRGGRSRFTVKTEIAGRSPTREGNWFRRLLAGMVDDSTTCAVSSEVLASGGVPEAAYWYAVSLENLERDNYDITITVRDVVSGREVSGDASFTVLGR